jgi:hypothetical protein
MIARARQRPCASAVRFSLLESPALSLAASAAPLATYASPAAPSSPPSPSLSNVAVLPARSSVQHADSTCGSPASDVLLAPPATGTSRATCSPPASQPPSPRASDVPLAPPATGTSRATCVSPASPAAPGTSLPQIPYASGSFAAVIASSVLEYIDDPQECLRELARVTEPRGALIFTVPNVRDPRRWAEATLRHVISPRLFKDGSKWQSYAEYLKLSKNRLGLAEWKQLLAQSGWELEQVNARDSALLMLIAKRTAARAEKVDQSEARITERATQADEHAVAVSHAG